MDLATTFVFYAVIGAAVAAAQFLTADAASLQERGVQVGLAWLFWPLYLPLLFVTNRNDRDAAESATANQLDPAIAQVEHELDVAWKSLDGWAEGVSLREADRLKELRTAWRAQAQRIQELDRLLASSESTATETSESLSSNERVRQSTQARQEHLNRLRALRQQMADDLAGTLAWVRELAAMIHVAKFTGAPASRAEELVAQIAAAIEGLSEVRGWQESEEAVVVGAP